ncbi:MAG: hypothetical protein M3Z20_14675 [Chloroflexota bacterium]|nr:hypothetical protein [Chloroflexota bacterium]
MSPDDLHRDPSAADGRDRQRHDLLNSLSVITARVQLLQRQLLRADGLANLERDKMRGNLAALLTEIRIMGARFEAVIGPVPASSGTLMAPAPAPTPPEASR